MNTCSFTYVPFHTYLPCRATGVERTWDYLKIEFEQQGDGFSDPTARYFETIGPGPHLFGVVGLSIYYHDQLEWHKFRSAFDIVFGTMEISN